MLRKCLSWCFLPSFYGVIMVCLNVLANALKSIKHQVFIKLVLIQSHSWLLTDDEAWLCGQI